MRSRLASYISEQDVEVLEYLRDVTVTHTEDYCSFTITFAFAPNDFFSNATLSKTYVLDSNIFEDEPSLKDVQFTKPEWKEGKDVTVKEVKKTQKAKSGKNKGQKRTVVTMEPQESFFQWFKAPTDPEEEDYDEEDGGSPFFSSEDDYELAHYLRAEIVPNAVKYFNGEVDEDDDDEDYDEDEDEDEDDEDDEDDDEDEEEDGGKGKGKGKGRGKGLPKPPVGGFDFQGGAKPPGPPGEQECKQN
jgi:nucleosome assembly protein 1-like 1